MAEIKPKKKLKPQKSMLTGLLKPAIKFAYKTYIKKHPMFKETTEAFAKKQISRVDKRFTISAGLTAMVKQLIKQNPKLHPKGTKRAMLWQSIRKKLREIRFWKKLPKDPQSITKAA